MRMQNKDDSGSLETLRHVDDKSVVHEYDPDTQHTVFQARHCKQ